MGRGRINQLKTNSYAIKMNHVFTALFILTQFCLFGQETKTDRIIKTKQTFINDKLAGYTENNQHGKPVFSKEDGLHGPVTMIFASEYDNLHRPTRIISAHSNVGFSTWELVYGLNRIEYYGYSYSRTIIDTCKRECLNKIDSREQFLKLKEIRDLYEGKRYLKRIEILDSAKNVIKEYSISKEGDTTNINTYKYDKNNKEIFSHKKLNSEGWTWDIHSIYDCNSNLIKSFRISSENGIKDTTEVYNYTYNAKNKLVSKNYYYKKEFRNKTDYIYNQLDQLEEEQFFEGDPSHVDVITLYKYDDNGNLIKKNHNDYTNIGDKEVYTYRFTYW